MNETKKRITVRVLPNLITILRVALTVIIIWIWYSVTSNFFAVLSITVLIFLTDVFDGKLARKLNTVTKAGEIIDVLADMGYILSMSVIMSIKSIIPNYFLVLICAEFIIFIITSRFLRDDNRYLIFDVAGRILAAIYYVTPIIMYTAFVKFTAIHKILFEYGFLILVVFTFVVVIYRISLCRVNLKQLILRLWE